MAEGAVISNLIDMLTEYLRDGISPIWRVREQVEPLKEELKAIHCFLRDMDGKEGKEATVKNWLNSVRDVAYEAEDLIEEFMIEGQNYAPFRAAMIYNSYGKRVKEIKAKISNLVEIRKKYSNFVEIRKKYVNNLPDRSTGQLGGTSSHVGLTWRRASSFLNDDPIVGFEQHTCNLMKVLLNPNEKLQVISITGMGGVGKTTLASVLYNEAHKVEFSQMTQLQLGSNPKESGSHIANRMHFDFFAWVTVGQDPDIPSLLMIILAEGGVKFGNMLSGQFIRDKLLSPDFVMNDLRKSLKLLLMSKKYLIVLDDVWSPDVCSQLLQDLSFCGDGSRIILTSRQQDIPSSVITSLYELKPINEEQSWQLFLNKAFPQSNQQNGCYCPMELEDLGRELSKKCYGLPLALVVLGGLLSRKGRHPSVWSELLESLNWVSTKDGQECLDILALSYADLSYHVKPCFLYLGAFRPDSEITTSKLIKLWAGDGLLAKREGRTVEEIGFEYLDELIQRCLVHVAIRGPDYRVKRIRLHGLISELALSVANESGFLYVPKECQNKMLVPENFCRRVAIHREMVDFPIKNSSSKLRALLAFPKNEACGKITVGRFILKQCPFYRRWASRLSDFRLIYFEQNRMMYIRVLELEGVHAKNDHFEFLEGDMLHLRYLSLRNTNLKLFPLSSRNLQRLQTLDIRGTSIKKLPDFLWKSKTLEHLYLNSIHPPSINGLTDLQTLVGASCPEGIARGLSSLTNLRYLKMELIDVSCGDEVINSLRDLRNLMSLKLYGEKIPQGVIRVTWCHQRLFKLNLQGKLQPNGLPSFGQFPPYLTQLTLSHASLEQDPMSTLKRLRSLRILKLKNNAYVGQEIVCSSGGFSELQYLKLSMLFSLRIFQVESRALPSLTRLSIHGRLTWQEQVTAGLEQLTTLQVLKFKGGACQNSIHDIEDFCQRNNVLLVNRNDRVDANSDST
jgi:NB-ARC domain/Rx N-terminal domain